MGASTESVTSNNSSEYILDALKPANVARQMLNGMPKFRPVFKIQFVLLEAHFCRL